MIRVQLVANEGCNHCVQVKNILEKLAPEFPEMTREEIPMTSPKGIETIQKYGIMASPGVIINDRLAFSGGGTEKQIRKALQDARNQRSQE